LGWSPAFLDRLAPGDERGHLQLREDQFSAIADPLHYALLSLLETPEAPAASHAWMAGRLRTSSLRVSAALQRLERLNLVSRAEGRLVPTFESLSTTEDIASPALRLSHRTTLEDAASTLDEVALELRDVSSMTMAIDPARLPKAKEMIREFRRQLAAYLEAGRRTEVYNLNLQLLPVTQVRQGEKK
jgi:uncharacterized protein (TIGR02147 family)